MRLERSAGRWRAAALAVACAGSVALAAGAGRDAGEARARRFVVEDERGKDRAVLGMNDDNRPTLRLYDGEGDCRYSVIMTSDGRPAVCLSGSGLGETRAFLMLDPDGSPKLKFFDSKGNPSASFPVPTKAATRPVRR